MLRNDSGPADVTARIANGSAGVNVKHRVEVCSLGVRHIASRRGTDISLHSGGAS